MEKSFFSTVSANKKIFMIWIPLVDAKASDWLTVKWGNNVKNERRDSKSDDDNVGGARIVWASSESEEHGRINATFNFLLLKEIRMKARKKSQFASDLHFVIVYFFIFSRFSPARGLVENSEKHLTMRFCFITWLDTKITEVAAVAKTSKRSWLLGKFQLFFGSYIYFLGIFESWTTTVRILFTL